MTDGDKLHKLIKAVEQEFGDRGKALADNVLNPGRFKCSVDCDDYILLQRRGSNTDGKNFRISIHSASDFVVLSPDAFNAMCEYGKRFLDEST